MPSGIPSFFLLGLIRGGGAWVATICERQDLGGQAEVPSRDGAGSATVRRRVAAAKKELFAVKGLKRRAPLTRTMRRNRATAPKEPWAGRGGWSDTSAGKGEGGGADAEAGGGERGGAGGKGAAGGEDVVDEQEVADAVGL